MTASEEIEGDFVVNALPGLEGQTGLPRSAVHLSIVHTNWPISGVVVFPSEEGGWDFVVARPYLARLTMSVWASVEPREPNPDIWWIYDADLDESECWVSQATFTPEGAINHEDDPRFDRFDRRMLGDEPTNRREDGEDMGEAFPSWGGETVSGEEVAAPRTHGPVTVSIDLDEHESNAHEGLGSWEVHGDWCVLSTERGFAVVHNNVGVVRFPDKTACSVGGGDASEAKDQAERFLAKRPYKSAYERVLGDDDDLEATPARPVMEPEAPTRPAIPRPKPGKRVWNTIPMANKDEDDD
jgi:hypothetical protein